MKKIYKHILSSLAMIGFMLLAIGSQISSPTICGDPRNVLNEPIPESGQVSTVRVRLVDQMTNEPIPNAAVHMQFILYFAVPNTSGNCDEAAMNAFPIDNGKNYVTNADGIVETTSLWSAADKKDAVVGLITVVAADIDYNPAETQIRLEQDDPLSTFTIPLLKDNLL